MSRLSLLVLLLLSVGLMGGTTCRFSSNTGSRDLEKEKKSGIQVVVDNRSSSTGGSGAGPAPTEVVRDALSTSVLVEGHAVTDAAVPAGRAASVAPALSVAPVRMRSSVPGDSIAAAPEPGGALLFACGALMVGWRVRSRRARSASLGAQSSPRRPTTVQL